MKAIALLGGVALLALAACAPGPGVQVRDTAYAKPSRIRSLPPACGLWQQSVVDRRSGAAAGTVATRGVIARELDARVARNLAHAGLPTAAGLPAHAVGIEILSAYGYSKSSSMTYTTVLRATLGATVLLGRGSDTGINWMSGDGEIASGLHRSVDLAAGALIEKLRPHCADT
ncbi:MAG: hypothetical protein ABIP49_10715 [Lysobacterales bacterium]